MTVLDYYSLLNIEPTASTDEVKKSFRQLAQRYHPDSNNETSNKEMFLRVQEAYSVLSNSKSRMEYDKAFFRESDLDPVKKKASSGGKRVKETVENNLQDDPEQNSPNDNESSSGVAAADRAFGFTKGSSKQSASAKAKRTRKRHAPTEEKGFASWLGLSKDSSRSARTHGKFHINDDRTYQISVDVLESLRGAQREIAIKDHNEDRRLKVKTPEGITNGTIIHIRERPDDPTDDTMLPVRVLVTSHPYLKRTGLDLHLTVPVTIAEAFKGTEIEVPTYKSVVRVKIPPLTKTNSALRLKNKGIEDESGNCGDFYVKAKMEPPDSSSQAAIESAEAIDVLYSEPVRKDMPKKLV